MKQIVLMCHQKESTLIKFMVIYDGSKGKQTHLPSKAVTQIPYETARESSLSPAPGRGGPGHKAGRSFLLHFVPPSHTFHRVHLYGLAQQV